MKATWVSKRGCLESLFQRNKQTLGKGKNSKTKEPPPKMFSNKGLMDKKQKKQVEF